MLSEQPRSWKRSLTSTCPAASVCINGSCYCRADGPFVALRTRSRPGRDSAAPACSAEIRHPKVVQITRGILELAGPTGYVGSVMRFSLGRPRVDGRAICAGPPCAGTPQSSWSFSGQSCAELSGKLKCSMVGVEIRFTDDIYVPTGVLVSARAAGDVPLVISNCQ
jgi:hypothetical protein